MSRRNKSGSKPNASPEQRPRATQPDPSPSVSRNPADAVMERAMRFVAAGKYEKALDILSGGGGTPQVRDARGVCLLRLGWYDEAIRIYRELVLSPGCTWMRRDLPARYKTNFATALLLAGRPSGCLELLDELKDEQNPSVIRLRSAIRRWVSTLSLWQKLNWWMGQIEPKNRPVTIDFVPGEFEAEVSPSEGPQPTTEAPPYHTAV